MTEFLPLIVFVFGVGVLVGTTGTHIAVRMPERGLRPATSIVPPATPVPAVTPVGVDAQ